MLSFLNPAVLTYCTKRCKGKEEGKEALYRKRKVLHLVSQWSSLYKDFLRDEEHVKLFMKVRERNTHTHTLAHRQIVVFYVHTHEHQHTQTYTYTLKVYLSK